VNPPPRLSTAQVAKLAGVHKDTLLRWLRAGLVREPQRDRRGWRFFDKKQAESIIRFAASEGAAAPDPAAHSQEIDRLRGIDWDFRDAKTGYLTHSIHPYPAKYIPQIPNALIQELSTTGETVGDVFCGSGTSLVEALLLKRNAVGVDANPLAVLISRVKTTALNEEQLAALSEIATNAETLAQTLLIYERDSLFDAPLFRSTGDRPEGDDLSFWFAECVIEELAEAKKWCDGIADDGARNAALVALSSIIVSVSRQDSDTRYVRRDKTLRPGDTLRKFAKSLRDSVRAIAELADVCEPRFKAKIITASVLDQPKLPTLDLVVCSPPYPNAYSYHLYHRTRMLWLGMDQPTFKRAEIGSHRKYSAKSAKAATGETFRAEMATVFAWLKNHLRRDRFACFVVGDSTIAGQRIDNSRLLTEAGAEHGFTREALINRQMHDQKKAFNPSIGRIKTESIVILCNREGPSR
jgi:site-specific DNA-methyltransferase (cytosine-N4-specific)